MTESRDARILREKALAAYEHVAAVARSFTDPVRLEIIDALAQGARTVESVAQVCGLPLKNVSHHLQKLLTAGLVDRVKLGRKAVYSLRDDDVAAFWSVLREFAQEHPIGSGPYDDGHRDEGVTAESLANLLDQNRVVVIDVRPPDEYESGHLNGAISMPLDQLEQRIDELPKGRPVVAFCRGPYCKLADMAVDMLRTSGYEALRCADGIVQWRIAGLTLVDEK